MAQLSAVHLTASFTNRSAELSDLLLPPPSTMHTHTGYSAVTRLVCVCTLSLSKLFTLSFSVWLFACSTESAKYWNPLCLGSCQVQLHHSFSPSSCPINPLLFTVKIKLLFFFKEKKSFMFFNVNDKALTSHWRNCYCKPYLICIFFWVTSWLMKLASVKKKQKPEEDCFKLYVGNIYSIWQRGLFSRI